MRILHMTENLQVHDILICFCGPTNQWKYPQIILRLCLEFAGLLRVGRHTILFEIYLPSKLKCHERKRVARKTKRKGRKRPRSRWMKAVMVEYRKNKSGGLSGAMRRANTKYRK